MMKAETLYANMVTLLREYGTINGGIDVELVIKSPDQFEKSKIKVLSVAASILKDCKYAMAGKAPTGIKTAYKRILKHVSGADHRLHNKLYGYVEGNDVYYLSNTYLIIEFFEKPEGLWPVEDNSMAHSCETLLKGFMELKVLEMQEVNKPEILDLKTAILNRKSKNVPADYVWEEGNKRVNAQYMLDILTIMGEDCKVYTNIDKTTSAIYFSSDKGNAALLPIRMND